VRRPPFSSPRFVPFAPSLLLRWLLRSSASSSRLHNPSEASSTAPLPLPDPHPLPFFLITILSTSTTFATPAQATARTMSASVAASERRRRARAMVDEDDAQPVASSSSGSVTEEGRLRGGKEGGRSPQKADRDAKYVFGPLSKPQDDAEPPFSSVNVLLPPPPPLPDLVPPRPLPPSTLLPLADRQRSLSSSTVASTVRKRTAILERPKSSRRICF
jgi:hypothetical protein